MKYTVGLATLGCKVAQYETEAITEGLVAEGFILSDFKGRCDLYVINTCTVTAESDRKCRQTVRRALKSNPDAKVIVCGCYSQRSPEECASIEGVSAVIGTGGKMTVPRIAKRLLSGLPPFEDTDSPIRVTDVMKEPFEKMKITKGPRTRVYVKVEDGCESRCTYCAISSARGVVRSKPPREVLEEVSGLFSSGVQEVVITGIETGSYGKDLSEKYSLAGLLKDIDALKCKGKIRLGSLAPELVGEEFARAAASVECLCPHFHISMQSGSDKVLALMKRRYNSKTALENIERLRALIPNAHFTTDLMVGFPGEDDEDFLKTKEFLMKAGFLDCHVFAYSKRKNTPAATYPNQVSEEIKRARSEELIALKNKVRDELLHRIVGCGKEIHVIIESYKNGYFRGHSDFFAEVLVKGSPSENFVGRLVRALPLEADNGCLICKIIK